MSSIKTPGVYVQEIAKFPPSVAQVETAVPAFIGYTEKAKLIANDDLLNKPKRISSLAEFESYYGGGAPLELGPVKVDSNLAFQGAATSGGDIFYLYNSLRMFYANGGGDCFIVSIGNYNDPITADAYIGNPSLNIPGGLPVLELEDEPTLILFPDATNLGPAELGSVQALALAQCNKLGDRFAILDLKNHKLNYDPVAEFRINIGTSYLKFGAAYTPWLQTTLGPKVTYSSIKGKLQVNNTPWSLTQFTNSSTILDIISDLDAALDYTGDFESEYDTLTNTGTYSSLEAKYNTLKQSLVGETDLGVAQTKFKAIITFLYEIAISLDTLAEGDNSAHANLASSIQTKITALLAPSYGRIIAIENLMKANTTGFSDYTTDVYTLGAYAALSTGTKAIWQLGSTPFNIFTHSTQNAADLASLFPIVAADDITGYTTTAAALHYKSVLAYLEGNNVISNILSSFTNLQASSGDYIEPAEQALKSLYPEYTKLLGQISSYFAQMPPSGAMAGVYAAVDRDRGVWKAPANVSVVLANGVTKVFTSSQLDDLNVDVNGGKSIDAIRVLSGLGTMVMGARTLAGNDNEWRYISVRRFFNMVEESVKKSTQWAVFEPNDANTWVKVQKMIENFLYTQWRAGALAGAKPEHAYYVSVGLNLTMTAEDILNGFMNVEIGMAVVRPAEFIVLKFSHKLQES